MVTAVEPLNNNNITAVYVLNHLSSVNSPDPDSRVPDEDLDRREPLHERLREVLAVPDAADGHLRRHVIAPEILSNSSRFITLGAVQ